MEDIYIVVDVTGFDKSEQRNITIRFTLQNHCKIKKQKNTNPLSWASYDYISTPTDKFEVSGSKLGKDEKVCR